MIQKVKRADINMLDGPIFSSMVRFAIPVLFSSIFQQLYNTMDTVIVGHTLGETALAAVGIGNGLSIVTARSYGSKNENTLKKSVAGSLVIGAILTLVLTLLTRVGLLPFLKLLNTPEEILQESYKYSSCITLFMGVTFAYNLGAGILRAVGNSLMPLLFLVVSSILNIKSFIVSFLIWSCALALDLSFNDFIDNSWLFYIICVPLEILTLFWYLLKRKKESHYNQNGH